MSTIVWCEDSGAGYKFWEMLFGTIDDTIVVESKNGVSKLRKAVSQIEDDVNKYIIVVDSAFDNPYVLTEVNRIKTLTAAKKNVAILSVISFEYVLLSFKYLIDWIFAEDDELKENRIQIIEAIESFLQKIELGESSVISPVLQKLEAENNIEQISASLLKALTKNTGFETNKSKLGECFVVDCCDWTRRSANDICGLDSRRLSLIEKMQSIVKNSVLNKSFIGGML